MSRLLPLLESPTARLTDSATFAVRRPADILPILDGLAAAMTKQGYTAQDVFGVRLALEEALVNALKHGHGYDPAKRARVRYRVTQRQMLADVEDQGPGFDPCGVADPLTAGGLERPSGRGLLLMHHFLSWVRHNRRGNRVTLCKRRGHRR